MFNNILIALAAALVSIYIMENVLGFRWTFEQSQQNFIISFAVALIGYPLMKKIQG